MARALASGAAPAGLFVVPPSGPGDPVGRDPAADVAEILRGMGELQPTIEVGQVLADAGRGSAILTWDWLVHQGKPTWSYTTPLALVETAEGWRAAWSPAVVHVELDPGERLRAVRLAAQRGEIIGADDTRLVFRHAVERVGLDLTLVDRATALASARALANELGIAVAPLVARVRAASDRAFVEAQVLRVGDAAQRDALAAAKRLPGVRGIPDERMLARTPTFARPLLGTVGEATAESIERGGGEVRPGDVVGLSGLQAAQDETLRGVTGFRVEILGDGDPVTLFEVEPRPGAPVRVTLDAALQERADAAVAADEQACSLVVLRPSDGHVLVAASGRGGKGLSTATVGRYPVGPPPPGLDAAASVLGWDAADLGVGVPALLGEVSEGTVWVSPLGLAAVAASVGDVADRAPRAPGVGVRPRLVLDAGAPPGRPDVSGKSADALEVLLGQALDTGDWAVAWAADRVVVAHREGGGSQRLADALR